MKQWLMKQPPWIYTIITTVLIYYLTLTPHPLPQSDVSLFEGADLVVHAIMFGTLFGALAFDYYRSCHRLSLKVECVMACVSVAAGGLVEILQGHFLATRSGDIYDFVADITGVVTAMSLVPVVKKVLH